MTPEDSERIEALTGALARLVLRQREMEERLARLESLLSVAAPPQPAAQPAPSAPMVSPAPLPEPAISAPVTPSRPLETAFGLTWISRIGVVTVVLALAFFFEYAFENHWITEWGRVALGLICGGASLFAGERFWSGHQSTFAQALTAVGIAFFYLSFWAAFGLYHLIGQPAAFGLMLLTTGVAGALALRYNGLAIAALGLAGGYATPLLLGSEKDPWFVLAYALLLDLGAAVAARARRWPWLEALALAGTVVLYASQMEFPPPAGSRLAYTVFLFAFYLLFAVSDLLPLFVTAQLLAGAALVQVWAPGISALVMALAIALAGLTVADRRGWSAAVSGSFAGFWLAYGAWHAQADAAQPPWPVLAVLTASFAAFLGWTLWRAIHRRANLRLQDLLVVALDAAFYFGACYGVLEIRYAVYEGLFAVAVAVALMSLARLLWNRDRRGAMLASGAAWVLLVLAAPIQFAGYQVTITWALEAAAITWIATRFQEPRAIYGAAGVFLLVLLRLALIDSAMYSNPGVYSALANTRFLTFTVAAASFWAVAWWLHRGSYAATAYLAGHGVLLWGLCLEAAGWSARAAAPENVRSVASTSISVLLAAYAVLLVAAGVLRRHAPTRILGVSLIGLVVLKLYLFDVWLLGQFYRMAAFAILGVLLLLMSYFYSRFRGSLETWWRP